MDKNVDYPLEKCFSCHACEYACRKGNCVADIIKFYNLFVPFTYHIHEFCFCTFIFRNSHLLLGYIRPCTMDNRR